MRTLKAKLDEINIPPRLEHSITAKVYGNKLATRSLLYNVGQTIVSDRINNIAPGFGLSLKRGLEDRRVLYDNMGTYVEVAANFVTGPLVNLLSGTATAENWPVMPALDSIGGITLKNGVCPPPPGDFKSWGTYVGELAANALKDTVTHYTAPIDPLTTVPTSES